MLISPLALLASLLIRSSVERVCKSEMVGRVQCLVISVVVILPVSSYVIAAARYYYDFGLVDVPQRVAAYLRSQGSQGRLIYVVDDHPIIYHLAGSRIPTRFPLPQHILSEIRTTAGTDPLREIEAVFAQSPAFVVVSSDLPLATQPEIAARIRELIATGYDQAQEFSSPREDLPRECGSRIVTVYRRRPAPSSGHD